MGKYLEEIVGEGPLATFLGFWSVMGAYFPFIQPLLITRKTSECTLCLQWHRTRTFAHLYNLGIVSMFTQIGVTVGEVENPRRNVPKGPHSKTLPYVATNPGSQPYEEVCELNHVRLQANDNSFIPAFFRITFFYIG